MNTPNNRRRRETREKMERVFMELVETKRMEDISVSEICKLAGVNRTTFYSNYDGIHSIAEAIKEDIENRFAALYEDEVTKGYNSNDFLRLFVFIKSNQKLLGTYFRLGFESEARILRYDTRLADEYFGGKMIDYHMEFFRAGITRIIRMWLDGGCRETPEEMNEVIRSEYRGREEFFKGKEGSAPSRVST